MSTSAPQAASAPQLTPLEERFVQEIDARLEELREPKQEYDKLSETRRRLVGTSSSNGRTTRGTTTPTAPRRARGSRQEEFVALVASHPGITIPQASEAMGVASNYLYRLRDKAKSDGTIHQEGQQFYPTEPDPARVKELEAAAAKGSDK